MLWGWWWGQLQRQIKALFVAWGYQVEVEGTLIVNVPTVPTPHLIICTRATICLSYKETPVRVRHEIWNQNKHPELFTSTPPCQYWVSQPPRLRWSGQHLHHWKLWCLTQPLGERSIILFTLGKVWSIKGRGVTWTTSVTRSHIRLHIASCKIQS